MDFFEFFLHKSSSTHRYFKGEYSGAPGAPVLTFFEKVVLSKFEFNLPTHYYTNTCVVQFKPFQYDPAFPQLNQSYLNLT